jgi:Outer membrane lipoprotein carrier protein LolA-like
MISGRVSATVAALLLVPAIGAVEAPTASLDSLLAMLARQPPQSIAFSEVHTSALLNRELIVGGTLEYAGPGKLSRVVTTPYSERTDIDGDLVRISRADGSERRFSLKHAPELGGLLTGFTALLAGDRAALEREFEIAVAGDRTAWQVTLTPRSNRVRARIERVSVHGTGDVPACIVTRSKDARAETELLLGTAAADSADVNLRERHCAPL